MKLLLDYDNCIIFFIINQIVARFNIFCALLSCVLGTIAFVKIKWYNLLKSFVLDFLGNDSIFSGKIGQPPPPQASGPV